MKINDLIFMKMNGLIFMNINGLIPHRQSRNEVTGEHSLLMVKPLGEDEHSWLPPAATDLFNDVLGLADTRLRGLDTALVHAMVKNHQATQPLPEGECERGKFLISLRLR